MLDFLGFFYHHYWLVGFFHLLVTVFLGVILDIKYTLWDLLIIWFVWPVYDTVLIALAVQDWRKPRA